MKRPRVAHVAVIRSQPILSRVVRGFLRASVQLYFKTIEVTGRERIPLTGPAVIVANHPNSVVDAFLIGTQLTDRTINFIAKDSIPRAPIVGPLVRKCGVIGVARMIDYAGDVRHTHGKNLKAIDTCTPHLEAGEIVSIFGEGVSTDSRKLGIIKKGAIRIAYNAEERNGFRLGVQIVPVGINYSAKEKFRSNVYIEVGEPFRITDLDPEPDLHKEKVLLRGTRRLQSDIEHLIVNINDEQLASLIEEVTNLCARSVTRQTTEPDLATYFHEKRRVAECLEYLNQAEPRFLELVQQSFADYQTLLRRMHLDDETVMRKVNVRSFLRETIGAIPMIGGSLVTLYGWLNNLLPRYLGRFARKYGRRRQTDPLPGGQAAQHVVVAGETSAAQYGAWIGAALGYPAQTILVASASVAAWGYLIGGIVASVYAVSLIPSWKFSIKHAERMRQRLSDVRLALTALRHRLFIVRIRRLRSQLVRSIRTVLERFDALRRQDRSADAHPAHLPAPE
jgi:glycerol-3-phosphate O-acyltransferase/dihydroxyacetone phosphate acyltransferase